MNQILQEQQRRYLTGVGKIGRTHQILTQLQQKMAGYHQRRKTEEQLLNSHEQPPPPKTKKSFKLFTKPQNQVNTAKMQMQELQVEKQTQKTQGKVGQLLQQVQAIQQLVRKKISLKQERIAQLEREIELQRQQKVHLYKINSDLEQQLTQIMKEMKKQENYMTIEQEQLERQLKHLKGIYDIKKIENKRLKKEQEILKETLLQAQKGQKGYHQSQIQGIRNQIRPKNTDKKQQKQQEEHYLRGLVSQLDKLRKMVKQKMKKSKSKLTIR